MKKSGVTLIGVGLILVAVLIILACVLIPRIQARARLDEALAAFMEEDAAYVLYTDPHYKNEGLLAPDGRDLVLGGELLFEVRSKMSALGADCKYHSTEKDAIVGTDKRLMVKRASGESVQLFFAADCFYLTVGGKTFVFTPADPDAQAALLQLLDAAI